MTTTTVDEARPAGASGSNLYLAFLPWVVITGAARRTERVARETTGAVPA
jgi:hypothetical protein